jgi:protoporphyrin/coproporphyrin ferrochelatase
LLGSTRLITGNDAMSEYDAFILVSFGGPEGPADVMPFLRNVTAGRGIPTERLEQVAEHYYLFGGVSPINQQCRDLLAAVEKDFTARGVGLRLYWGNRNWQPYLTDAVRQMAADGVRRALAFVTSAYSSFSSCRQYLGDIEAARAQAGPAAPRIDKIRQFYNHPGFIGSFAASAAEAVGSLPDGQRDECELIFVAHSVPLGMANASGPVGGAYQAQLASAAGLVAAELGFDKPWQLAYCSRSGPPSQPWLEPDVNDLLAELAGSGSRAVVVVPIGFVSDHMEVKFDLDVEAAQTAQRLGLAFARAAAPGTDHRFVSMIADLVRERLDGGPAAALGSLGAGPDFCPAGCCAIPGGDPRNPRGALPARGGQPGPR